MWILWLLLGDVDAMLQSLIAACHKQSVPCVFALGRKALGRVCSKPVPVSVVGVVNCSGVEVPAAQQLLYYSLMITSQNITVNTKRTIRNRQFVMWPCKDSCKPVHWICR